MNQPGVWVRDVLPRLFGHLRLFDYAVLRNYEGLPDRLTGNDLDLVMKRAEVSRFIGSLDEITDEVGGQRVITLRRPHMTVVKLLGPGATPEVLHVDVFHQLGWSIFATHRVEDLLEHRVLEIDGPSPVWRLSNEAELLGIVLHHGLWSGRLHKSKYVVRLQSLSPPERQHLREELARAVGGDTALRILSHLLREEPLGSNLLWRARRRVVLQALRSGRTWAKGMSALISELRLYRDPQGLLLRSSLSRGVEQEVLSWVRGLWQFNHILDSDFKPVDEKAMGEELPEWLTRKYRVRSTLFRWAVARRLARRGAIIMVRRSPSRALGSWCAFRSRPVPVLSGDTGAEAVRQICAILRRR